MFRRLLVPFVLLLAAPLSACAAGGSSSGKPVVIASFYPLQFVAERVAGDRAEVTNLTKPGLEPHDLELRPRQVAALADADVAIYESGFQPAVDAAIEQNQPEQVVDAAATVDLASVEGEKDPHFWLDPTLLAEVSGAFAEAMADADPDNAAEYERNAASLRKDLTALDAEFKSGLRECRTRSVVVAHDAFGYLGKRYALDVESIAGISPDAEPSPARLAELSDLAQLNGVTTIFSETLVSPKLAETLADDAGLRTGVLDPIEGLTSDDDRADYLSLMRDNLEALRTAGGCA